MPRDAYVHGDHPSHRKLGVRHRSAPQVMGFSRQEVDLRIIFETSGQLVEAGNRQPCRVSHAPQHREVRFAAATPMDMVDGVNGRTPIVPQKTLNPFE